MKEWGRGRILGLALGAEAGDAIPPSPDSKRLGQACLLISAAPVDNTLAHSS
jgi:hypothetical protein